MRGTLAVIGLVLAGANSIPAQEAAPAPAGLNREAAPVKAIYGDQPLFLDATAPSPARLWRGELMLGAPAGIRVQRHLGNGRLWGELGAGIYAVWPTVFVGVRGEGSLFEGRHDSFVVRPGLSAYYLQGWNNDGNRRLFDGIPTGGMLALDFDLNWNHCWHEGLASELGLKLGAGVGFFRRGVVLPLPLASMTIGFNF